MTKQLNYPTNDQKDKDQNDSSVSQNLSDSEKRFTFEAELENWENCGAFTPVGVKSGPRHANIIGSHTIFNSKLDSTAKARIVPWGHSDKNKDFIRGDATSVSLRWFRTKLSISAENKWHVALMDLITAFLHVLGLDREFYIRPPREADAPGVLWKLNVAENGRTDS